MTSYIQIRFHPHPNFESLCCQEQRDQDLKYGHRPHQSPGFLDSPHPQQAFPFAQQHFISKIGSNINTPKPLKKFLVYLEACLQPIRSHGSISKNKMHAPTTAGILLVGLAYQGMDIVFRSIIEYGSLRDFGP
jgi:hypothetical protein